MPMERVEMPDGTARYIPKCKVCEYPGRARLIEADRAAGRSAAVIAKDMTDAGWPITDKMVLRHMKHAKEPLPTPVTKRVQPDGVEFVKGRLLDAIVAKERRLKEQAEKEGEQFNSEFLLDKDLQPALNTVLKAENIKVKRDDVASKRQIGLFTLMLGKSGGLAPAALIGDGTIEGEFVDVTKRDLTKSKRGEMLEDLAHNVQVPDYPEGYDPYEEIDGEEDEDEEEDSAASE